MTMYLLLMWLAKQLGPRKTPGRRSGYDILLTGTFHSENWVAAHLHPLAMSKYCKRLRVVSVNSVPAMAKVEILHPPAWIKWLLGAVPARLVIFAWVALRDRPDIIGGFHLLFNGLVANVLGMVIGAHSLYFCVGGPTEILDGGIQSENRLFEMLPGPDSLLEKNLLGAVKWFDLVITMGTGATKFFLQNGIHTEFQVVSGGIDKSRFFPAKEPGLIDLVTVGRLAPIKRTRLLLEIVAEVKRSFPSVRAVVVGDGPLRSALRMTATELGIEENVLFVGNQKKVDEWLRRAKIFVLTSESEGLSLAMMEAMMCGLPAVVPDVGDLGDLVENRVNGFLITEHDPQAYVTKIVELLRNTDRLKQFSRAAHMSAARYEMEVTSGKWDLILSRTGSQICKN